MICGSWYRKSILRNICIYVGVLALGVLRLVTDWLKRRVIFFPFFLVKFVSERSVFKRERQPHV